MFLYIRYPESTKGHSPYDLMNDKLYLKKENTFKAVNPKLSIDVTTVFIFFKERNPYLDNFFTFNVFENEKPTECFMILLKECIINHL